MQRKHIVLAGALSSLLAVGLAQAQTVVVPTEPQSADTILIVTPADPSAAQRDDSLPRSRDEVRAEARDAASHGGTPRGEQNWADQSRHQQSPVDPYAPAGNTGKR